MDKITYQDAFFEALTNKELVAEYDRLFEVHLSNCILSCKKQSIHFEIDKATGFLKHEIEKFKDFFNEYIYLPSLISEND